jgi:hypothetical protein
MPTGIRVAYWLGCERRLMINIPLGQWLDEFAVVARREMLKLYRPDNCVLATRLGLQILKYFRIDAVAEPVAVRACTTQELLVPGTGHSIGTAGTGRIAAAPGSSRMMWDGHLVIRLRAPTQFVDLTVDALHRPHRGLHVPGPIVTPPFDLDFWRERRRLAFAIPGGAVTYDQMADESWCSSAAWASPLDSDMRSVIGAGIRALKNARPDAGVGNGLTQVTFVPSPGG